MSKKRVRFNFLDVLIILATLALVAGIIWREELTERIETRNIENTVTVSCDLNAFVSTDKEGTVYAVKFEEGNTPVYMDGVEVGYVQAVRTVVSQPDDSVDDTSKDEDTPQEPQIVEETKLFLKAVSRSSGYYIGGETKLLIGGEYLLHTKTSEFTVRILSAEEVKTK